VLSASHLSFAETMNDTALGALNYVSFAIGAYAVILSITALPNETKKYLRLWRTRNLRRIWGIKDGDFVILVCSELDDPEKRQNVEEREYIYNLKYGDVDAYFEVVITLLRLYPNIRLRVLSSGEAENVRIDMTQHLILIGGPDYNAITENFLGKNITQYDYRSPYVKERSTKNPDEIVLYNRVTKEEFCELTEDKDYGYFEKIRNPNNPEKHIILIGGCHTTGVTGAVKSFSMAESEQGEIPSVVLNNAKMAARKIGKNREFAILVQTEKIGQTINTPVIESNKISFR